MAISKEAQAAIDLMMRGRAAKEAAAAQRAAERRTALEAAKADGAVKADALARELEAATLYEAMQAVFEERRQGEVSGAARPLPNKLALSYAVADGVRGEWLRCLRAEPGFVADRVVLFLHGGGFASGSAVSRRALAAKITLHAKVDSFSIDYRQSPEYRYPAHLDDCVMAFVWLLKQGYAPGNVCVFGESAGATLALALPLYLRDHHLPLPGGVCAFSPLADMASGYDSWVTRANQDAMIGESFDASETQARLEAYRKNGNPLRPLYCDDSEAACPYVSPARGDFHGFPRLMLQVGVEERLYDDSIDVATKARAAGVDVVLHEWEGLGHVFALFDCPETELVCAEIGRFARGE